MLNINPLSSSFDKIITLYPERHFTYTLWSNRLLLWCDIIYASDRVHIIREYDVSPDDDSLKRYVLGHCQIHDPDHGCKRKAHNHNMSDVYLTMTIGHHERHKPFAKNTMSIVPIDNDLIFSQVRRNIDSSEENKKNLYPLLGVLCRSSGGIMFDNKTRREILK